MWLYSNKTSKENGCIVNYCLVLKRIALGRWLTAEGKKCGDQVWIVSTHVDTEHGGLL